MPVEYRTCRFCGNQSLVENMVKYGKRHHAHHDCYLAAGKPVESLPQWKQDQFVERGLVAKVAAND